MTLPATELCRLLAVVNALVDARRGAWALLRASRPAPAPTPRRRTGFSVAAATLITLREEKKKSAAKGALEVFGPSTRGMRGSAGRYACRTPGGPVCLSNAGRTCRFQRGGRRIAAHGGSVAQLDRSPAAGEGRGWT